MMDQTSVMENAKEKMCYVSTKWEEDWETAKCVRLSLFLQLLFRLATRDEASGSNGRSRMLIAPRCPAVNPATP